MLAASAAAALRATRRGASQPSLGGWVKHELRTRGRFEMKLWGIGGVGADPDGNTSKSRSQNVVDSLFDSIDGLSICRR